METIPAQLVGPVAGLAIALAIIYSLLYTRKIEPGYVGDALRTQNAALEKENVKLHDEVLALSKDRAGMEERIRSLEERTADLTEQIEQLRKKLGDG